MCFPDPPTLAGRVYLRAEARRPSPQGARRAAAGAQGEEEGAAGDAYRTTKAAARACHRAQGSCCCVHAAPALADRLRAPQAIKAATVPVSKLVEVADRTAVHLLPAALRTLFSALDAVAQQHVSEERRILVSVQGSPDLAAEAEPAADAVEAGEVQDEEDEERRSTKRARTGDDGVHPMSVLLELHARGSKRAGIVFELVPSRGLVAARVEDGDAALLDGILGESLVEAAGGGEEGEAAPVEDGLGSLVQLAWVQKLAGLDGSPEPAHAEAVVAALHAAAMRS